ncbi:MAG: PadR family transcriptional regulator [Gammaproteobacteria bacterium]|nr:PadR family transcriptional regulator [Gammaproteobacteria bacterium]
MINSVTAKFRKDLNAGVVGLAVLAALAAEDGDVYGYELAKRAPFRPSSIYPVLRALCAAGWLSSRVVPSYAGPARRYYRITAKGRETLAAWRETWLETRNFVNELLER